MYALECGTKVADTEAPNACSVEDISSPDNVIYVPYHDAVLIGAAALAALA